jgi:hypothetical protein
MVDVVGVDNGDTMVAQQRYQRMRAVGSGRGGVHPPARSRCGQVCADRGDDADGGQRE